RLPAEIGDWRHCLRQGGEWARIDGHWLRIDEGWVVEEQARRSGPVPVLGNKIQPGRLRRVLRWGGEQQFPARAGRGAAGGEPVTVGPEVEARLAAIREARTQGQRTRR